MKIAFTNKQLKKKARKLKKGQKAKVAPGAILSDESGVLGAPTKVISHSCRSSMPALSDTVAPTISECNTSSEEKHKLATENERPSRPSAKDSSSDHGGQLLAQQIEFRQRIEKVDKESDSLMAELKQQGKAAEAKYMGLMSGIRQWADARELPTEANAPVSCLF